MGYRVLIIAIDTTQKKLSLLNFGDGTTIHVLFEADASINTGDKQHMLDCYSGIAFATSGLSGSPFRSPIFESAVYPSLIIRNA